MYRKTNKLRDYLACLGTSNYSSYPIPLFVSHLLADDACMAQIIRLISNSFD